ncbi:MAG: phosphopantetheine-binding protein [Planctomycetaceae bacterium]|jgi:acyl carrier protein|nr:phosphopantetheine-binding protein [Planctomycetaceae bacterium]
MPKIIEFDATEKRHLRMKRKSSGQPERRNELQSAPIIATPIETPKATVDLAELQNFLINFVMEETGYPEEMVELDIDLEGELGIDSIKKAQLFGELSQQYPVQRDENVSFDDITTLRHILDYVQTHLGSTDSVAKSVSVTKSIPVAKTQTVKPAVDAAELQRFLINFVMEETGYPEEMVELDIDLEGELGIDSIKKAQLFGELSQQYPVQRDENVSFDDITTLRHILDYVQTHIQ